ncbi:hypothetical protein [Streptomyces gulbargensis]|uniref:hypothetical protein n=1 Tax=Streptomyces gulbargensis TaxID=364901 RepID=UPI0031EFA08F
MTTALDFGAVVSAGHGLSDSFGAVTTPDCGMGEMDMERDGIPEVRPERRHGERLTEGLLVIVASVLSFGLLLAPAVVSGTTAWHLVTDTGTTAFSRLAVPVILLALVALPLILAHVVFRSGRRKGRKPLTAAAPAALTLLGASVVPFAALCLIFVFGD